MELIHDDNREFTPCGLVLIPNATGLLSGKDEKWYVANKGVDDWNCGTSYHPCRTLGAKWSETFGNASTGRRVDRVQVIVQSNLTLGDTELVNAYSGDNVVYLEFLDHGEAVQLRLVNLTFYRVIFEVKTADISFTLEECHFDASGIYVYFTHERSRHDVTIDGCEFLREVRYNACATPGGDRRSVSSAIPATRHRGTNRSLLHRERHDDRGHHARERYLQHNHHSAG